MIKKKIIFTSGVYDLFHFGHLNIIRKAKAIGDYLIVGVSTDALVKKYKGIKPIISHRDRIAVIKALRYVDKVVPQRKLIDLNQFKDLKIDLFILGDDWKDRYDNEGINWLRNHNKIIFLPYTQRLSTSKIKEKIIRNSYDIMKNQIRRNK